MKSAYLFLIVILLSVACSHGSRTSAAEEDRPNILLIVADDLGFSDLGCYGGEIHTPNLDRLAAEGMRFTQFYNCGAGSLTRAALYSGHYPRLGPGGSTTRLLRRDTFTVGEALRDAGYATILTGKWPLGAAAPDRPIDQGFSEFYGLLGVHAHHFNPAEPDPLAGVVDPLPFRKFAHNDHTITKVPDDFYSTDAFSDHAVEMIRRAAASRQPFFLNLCYTAPHYPIHARAGDIARYRGKYSDGYDALRERRYRRQIELGLIDREATKLSSADLDYLYEHEMEPWRKLNEESRQRDEERMEAYAAMVDRLDQGIGRVLAALDETRAAANTIVFFLSDNGGNAHFPIRSAQATPRQERRPVFAYNLDIPVGDRRGYEFLGFGWGWATNAPFRRYKYWTYEGGICTPMIVRWPRVTAEGAISTKLAHVVDFMPTLLELAGVKLMASQARGAIASEGQSFVPLLRGETSPRRLAPIAWELFGSRALRDEEWKLLWGAGEKRWELYDLATDRTETIDVAARYPDRVAAMAERWKAWAERTGAPIR